MAPWEATCELRTQVHERLAQATPTLIWFARQLSDGRGIPLNTWHRVDRPLGRRSTSHGPAFDVWHAILRAERALRNTYPEEARRLRIEAKNLGGTLERLTTEISKDLNTNDDQRNAQVRRLTSDDIFGTFNGLTAASVLRSEIFPERSPATPSYLAGHVIVSELRVAREQARSSGTMAIRERQPRVAVVAECVHSLMLYVEHLRARSRLFRAIGKDIERICDLYSLASVDQDGNKALGGYLRVVMLRVAIRAEECSSLVLSTKQFFSKLSGELRKAAGSSEPPNATSLKDAILNSIPTIDVKAFESQQRIKEAATDFCEHLAQSIRNVHDQVHALLRAEKTRENASSLAAVLKSLDGALTKLLDIHTGVPAPQDAPSIADAARFQFAQMLVNCLLDKKNGTLKIGINVGKTETTAILKELQFIRQTYLGEDVEPRESDLPFRYVADFIAALGSSAIGTSLDLWWDSYATCYAAGTTHHDTSTGRSAVPHRRHDHFNTPSWIDLRHKSFEGIQEFANDAKRSKDSVGFSKALLKAAEAIDQVANETHAMVRELTDWCFARRHELLQARRLDPHELAASLWIADRIGEPWHERFEIEVLEEIKRLQRPGGAFPAMAPLFHSRGFIFQVPSASTISMLARFVTAGTSPPRSRLARERLIRWKPVLEEGARFLVAGMVGQQRSPISSSLRLHGWHSDRHPETDRIDCYATTEAVTGLCRLDDALRWLVNLEAMDDLRVSWPEPAVDVALPTDCRFEVDELNPEQRSQLVTVLEFAEHQRSTSALYTREFGAWGKGADTHVFMLYGPPGTGKTHFQSLAAGELGWPVLTLTIADFLFEGEDRIARRADELFKRLGFLSCVGIVFDEFDDMVARREAAEPRSLAGFRPLTSAMLPLLAELREHARRHSCLVSCTTNFIENIDSAAKRVGRVDKKLLVVYPDFQFRLLLGMGMIVDRLPGTGGSEHLEEEQMKVDSKQLMNRLREAAEVTGLCTFPDIRDYIKRVVEGILTQPNALNAVGDPAPLPVVPAPAINVDYYQTDHVTGSVRDEVRRSIFEMRASIGDDRVIGSWLKVHPDWKELFDQVRGGNPDSRQV